MRFNRSVQIVRGGVVDPTVYHAKKVPTEDQLAQLCKMYGKLDVNLLNHLKSRRPDVKTNEQYEDLSEQIDMVQFAIDRKITLVQPKVTPFQKRLKTLRELVYDTFVGQLVPSHGPHSKSRPDYFYHALPEIKRLAAWGGVEYEAACTAIRFAYAGKTFEEKEASYRDAVLAVIPPLE